MGGSGSWNHVPFVPFQVNFAALNSTYEVDTPCCSAKQLDVYYKAWSAYRKASKASADSGTPLTLEKPVLPGSDEKEEDPERKKSSASGRVNFAMAMGQGRVGSSLFYSFNKRFFCLMELIFP